MDINQLSSKIIGAAIEVHRALGPGLLESSYQKCTFSSFDGAGFAEGRLFFAFRPLNGKQNKKFLCSLCASAVKKRPFNEHFLS